MCIFQCCINQRLALFNFCKFFSCLAKALSIVIIDFFCVNDNAKIIKNFSGLPANASYDLFKGFLCSHAHSTTAHNGRFHKSSKLVGIRAYAE
ncbi:MAG: hypothetical protein BWY95_02288 [Bacteroidetes bacterium ADurb.BinA104]|nr:MAG: hypothetical protein BWY95_02288 [Bacteroidetes bacterium ADurb.BinA104]